MESITTLATTENEVHRDLRVVDRLVRSLGSTLDVGEIAARSLPILSEELGYAVSTFVLIDDVERSLEVVGALGDEGAAGPVRWPLGPALASRLLGTGTFLRIEADELPEGLRASGDRVAFRMTDGGVTVGFVLLPGSHVVESGSAHEEVLVRTVGGLIGSLVSRALVHQALLRVTDRLDGARRLQQHVLDHVSHEFNTPLMILKSVSEFADTDDGEERGAFLDMQRQAVERLEDLVQGVLEVARTRSDTTPHALTFDEFDRVVLEPALDAKPWRRDGLRVHVDLPPEGSMTLDVDGCALGLEHLLRNAWSFAAEQGAAAGLGVHLGRRDATPLSLDAALAALAAGDLSAWATTPAEQTPDALVLEVVDAGIGIPSDEVEAVFEPFYQARNSPLRGVSGAGMGLSTARKRIESMGGSLRLDSELGRGTRVRITIPLGGRTADPATAS